MTIRQVTAGVAGVALAIVVNVGSAAASPDYPPSPPDDLCISVNGVVTVQRGTATCSSVPSDVAGSPNIATARGAGSDATAGTDAGDSGNTATAHDGGTAIAKQGDGNTAIASGPSAFAEALRGNDNTSIVLPYPGTSENAQATTQDGDSNLAVASGTGDNVAAVSGGNDNTVSTYGDNSYATHSNGNGNTLTATGDGSRVNLQNGNNNTLTATGACSISLAGVDDVTDSCSGPPATPVELTPVTWTIDGDVGVRTIFMEADASPLTVDEIEDFGGSLIWPETTIVLCNDPENPGIGIREVGSGYVRIGDGFQSDFQTAGCAINTTMARAFADYGNPSNACLYVTVRGERSQYCAPLALE
jgi:hypothetical protein